MKSISVENLSKSFVNGKETVEAVKPLSFEIDKAELFGFIGPDGAGKTTLIRMLTTLILADTGSATVDGFDVVKDYKEIRKRIGYMPGKFSLYQDLSVQENLEFFATIFQTTVKENYHLIKDIYDQLAPFSDRPAGKLSGGMKQKLALCCALIHKPTVLFLDEPTTGVDAVSRKEFWEMLKRLKEQGITILVSTPYMDEASLCDRVALMQDGKFLRIDTPTQIIKNYSKPLLAVKGKEMFPLLQHLKQIEGIEMAYPFGEYHHVVLQNNTTTLDQLKLQLHIIKDLEIKQAHPDIEDCFIYAMQNN
ncbi:MAG: ABC transporter ATP-binding protein [Bacteroidia bacterium]|nr:ABC transporter ATP-binding protein [Bacteroidia bacterium]MBP7245534.1 ABC transporter ATP-binding protein [Bacteroidia bacterium]